MYTTHTRAAAVISSRRAAIRFEQGDSLARVLRLFTPHGATARLTTSGDLPDGGADGELRIRDVRLVDVVRTEDGTLALGIVEHDPAEPRYIAPESRPDPEELELVELDDIVELYVHA